MPTEEEILKIVEELYNMDKPEIITEELFDKIQLVAAYNLNNINKQSNNIN